MLVVFTLPVQCSVQAVTKPSSLTLTVWMSVVPGGRYPPRRCTSAVILYHCPTLMNTNIVGANGKWSGGGVLWHGVTWRCYYIIIWYAFCDICESSALLFVNLTRWRTQNKHAWTALCAFVRYGNYQSGMGERCDALNASAPPAGNNCLPHRSGYCYCSAPLIFVGLPTDPDGRGMRRRRRRSAKPPPHDGI